MKYFKSDIDAKIGDMVATGSFGQCRVIGFLDGEMEVENIFTKERGFVFSDDCDLIEKEN